MGDILHCWYKPRQKNTCGNCLVPVCKTYYAMEFGGSSQKEKTCSEHRNFFGKANARIIIHCGEKKYSQGIEYDHLLAIDGVELHIDYLGNQNEVFLESWARADGFANFQEAHKWFLKSTKNPQWTFQSWDIIIFKPEWVLPTIEESVGTITCPHVGESGGCDDCQLGIDQMSCEEELKYHGS